MLDGYHGAIKSSAYFIQGRAGCLRLRDQDRVAFLQRQTTNDLSLLAPDRSVLTVLVSPVARILDVLRVLLDSNELIVLTLPGHREDTTRYFKRRIFFTDKVSLEDESELYIQVDLEGPRAAEALLALGFTTAPEIDGIAVEERDGRPLTVMGQRGLSRTGYRLLVPVEIWEATHRGLVAAGAEQLSEESFNVLRVEAGLPAAGAELTEEFTPFEAGLEHAVSGNKGCFTGQEVLARQVTYDKVTRHMVRLRLEAAVQTGERLYAGGEPVGVLTSAAVSPRFGPVALGIVKRPHHKPGSELSAGENGPRGVVSEPT